MFCSSYARLVHETAGNDGSENAGVPFYGEDEKSMMKKDNNIRKPAAITAITYQALYAAMENLRITEEAEDYSGFDLIKTVREAGIHTICLDECHHLRSEWWKALESFMEKLGNEVVVSLTDCVLIRITSVLTIPAWLKRHRLWSTATTWRCFMRNCWRMYGADTWRVSSSFTGPKVYGAFFAGVSV